MCDCVCVYVCGEGPVCVCMCVCVGRALDLERTCGCGCGCEASQPDPRSPFSLPTVSTIPLPLPSFGCDPSSHSWHSAHTHQPTFGARRCSTRTGVSCAISRSLTAIRAVVSSLVSGRLHQHSACLRLGVLTHIRKKGEGGRTSTVPVWKTHA